VASLEVRKSSVYGLGCFTLEPIKRRRKIAPYAGEFIRGKRKVMARIYEQEERGVIKVIRIGDDLGIDGEVGGDATAYINHSCAPNAFMRVVPGDWIVFFALRDIEAGEEITMDYRDPNHPAPEACRCGAPNCRSLKQRK
jgi:SET domain-containing protein